MNIDDIVNVNIIFGYQSMHYMNVNTDDIHVYFIQIHTCILEMVHNDHIDEDIVIA